MKLTPGSRWKSAICEAEVVVVRAPAGEVALSCGGVEMIAAKDNPPDIPQLGAPQESAALLGKRYMDETSSAEFLCNRSGNGALSIDGRTLTLKEAKKLPSSD
jgi:hypothetical protein